MNQQYDRYITAFSSGTDQGVEKLSSELGILSPRSVCSWLARASSGHVVVNVVFYFYVIPGVLYPKCSGVFSVDVPTIIGTLRVTTACMTVVP